MLFKNRNSVGKIANNRIIQSLVELKTAAERGYPDLDPITVTRTADIEQQTEVVVCQLSGGARIVYVIVDQQFAAYVYHGELAEKLGEEMRAADAASVLKRCVR